MNKLAIALIIIQVVCLIGVVLFIQMDYKKKHPPLCDGCDNLITKGCGVYKYRCRYWNFDRAPEICNHYKPKEGADHA